MRDLEDRGDFSLDRSDLLGAGAFEETESRLELEVMLLAMRTYCGYPQPMYVGDKPHKILWAPNDVCAEQCAARLGAWARRCKSSLWELGGVDGEALKGCPDGGLTVA